MSVLNKLKIIWITFKEMRALKREGVTDPGELRRLVIERTIKRAAGIDLNLSDHFADIPDEALDVWENYDPGDDAPARITERHLDLIRRIRFSWNMTEVGAPRVDCKNPYGSSDPLRDIAEALGEAPVPELAKRHADMTGVLSAFFSRAKLQPGSYEVDCRTFSLTADHLTLAQNLVFRWDNDCDPWPTPSVDPKRPYGDFTFYQKEMAIHLGWLSEGDERDLTNEEISRLEYLHFEMLDALRVIAAHGTVEPDSASG